MTSDKWQRDVTLPLGIGHSDFFSHYGLVIRHSLPGLSQLNRGSKLQNSVCYWAEVAAAFLTQRNP